jgi:hypothetical protein
MEAARWTNPSHPQVLQSGVMLLYLNAALTLLQGGIGGFAIPVMAGLIAAGYGIANDKRWGYQLGIAMAFVPFAIRVIFFGLDHLAPQGIWDAAAMAFDALLVYLLLHRESREYQRIWFE